MWESIFKHTTKSGKSKASKGRRHIRRRPALLGPQGRAKRRAGRTQGFDKRIWQAWRTRSAGLTQGKSALEEKNF
ncbi:hypothetical protein LJC36_05185 [Desulfovibrio sp. OttesenSCG-928-C14]|nr:hypothetical protein [Desulfovibrio sp. OttesenSCG-928-C14]